MPLACTQDDLQYDAGHLGNEPTRGLRLVEIGTAVHDQRLSCDESGIRPCQKAGGTDDIARKHVARQHSPDQRRSPRTGHQRRVASDALAQSEAGGYAIYANAIGAELAGE